MKRVILIGVVVLTGAVALRAAAPAKRDKEAPEETQETQDTPSPSGGVVDGRPPLDIHGPLVRLGSDGKLVYKPYDAQGDVIPDFSNCGYMGGGVAIPSVATKVTVKPESGSADDTARLQHAIDQVAVMQPDGKGIRGALLLDRGTYRISGTLKISTSGVVLRGVGRESDGTVLIATGNKVRPLIEVKGASGLTPSDREATKITDNYVPVGAHRFSVENGSSFHVGDTIILRRFGNAAWIHELKMDQLIERKGTKQWQPFAIDADRVVTAVSGNTLTVDAPIVCAIDQKWGGGEVVHYRDEGRITQVGVEDLRAISEFNPSVTSTVGATGGKAYPADEVHATDAVSLDDCKNCWVQRVAAQHFVHGVAKMLRGAKWVTVQDSQASDPVSIITGGRRYPFSIQGQLDLVLRCDSKGERHAFVNNGSHEPGPDAFVMSTSEDNHADSGPHQRWSTGTLWDNISGVMHTQDREDMGSGHGWAGANDVYWNCTGTITIEQPQTAENFAFGFVGQKQAPAFARLKHPSGYYESFGKPMEPKSLYFQQLKDRLGSAAVDAVMGAPGR